VRRAGGIGLKRRRVIRCDKQSTPRGFAQHPFERDIGEAGLDVAAATVRMRTGKPHLRKDLVVFAIPEIRPVSRSLLI
jgi:hypothetical protein